MQRSCWYSDNSSIGSRDFDVSDEMRVVHISNSAGSLDKSSSAGSEARMRMANASIVFLKLFIGRFCC